ncbi:MAG: acyltransferase [Actinobacteria bacterium]|nr:acyltransferase [Actinomycetota bacterium]
MPEGRRAHLDGLRTVAVYLVILFHGGLARYRGGHIGVDVFFVLSGYLVTGVLLRDLARSAGGGRIRFGRFYARRARRLLPAAIVCLLATAVAYAAFAPTADLLAAVDGFRAAAVYLTNWYLISNATGYFATDTTHSPILHFWSLAVEEQFYLVWPLLFTGIVALARRAGRHRWNVVRAVVAALAAASAVELFLIRGTRPDHAYYGTDVRAYQLLAGALLALTPVVIARARRLGRVNDVIAIGALVGLVGLTVTGTRTGPIARGYATTVLTVALLVALESGAAGLGRRILAWRPVVYLGSISYGTYLWHWPVIVIASLVGDFDAVELTVLSIVLGTALAALSNEIVEQPIRTARRLDRIAWPVAAVGLSMSLLTGFVVLPGILDRTQDGRSSSTAAPDVEGFTPVPASFSYKEVEAAGFGEHTNCDGGDPQDCILVRGTGPHIALVGDSNSVMWVAAFRKVAEANDLTFSHLGRSGCRWQDGLFALSRQAPEDIAKCERNHRFVYDRAIPELQPDLIVMTNSAELEPPSSRRPAGPVADDIERTTTASLERLSDEGREVLVIESKPFPTGEMVNPLACLADATFVEECRFVTASQPSWIEKLERDLADRLPGVATADLDRLGCPFLPICDPIIDGIPVFWDARHYTPAFVRTLAPALAAFLREQGYIE